MEVAGPMPLRDLKFNLATASCFGKPLLALSDLEYSEALLKWKDREAERTGKIQVIEGCNLPLG